MRVAFLRALPVIAVALVASVLAAAVGAAGTQVIAAGKSATNLPTETVWPGAQDPPYVCCWSSQGQYVTFAFSTNAGSTNLTLRYSAGNGVAHRTIDVDGAVVAADEAFPATASWSTWATVTLDQSLTSGSHTLNIWYDATAGSDNYMNLDNLTVTPAGGGPAAPGSVLVSLGYADNRSGPKPWDGSSHTIFIGRQPTCCSTHGPDNGKPGYDGGAIEITNKGATPATVDGVTADFGGGSSPSHFDIWSADQTSPGLPQTLARGEHLVLTATTNADFDTSDLFGEACNPNSGVVGVVHVTINGVETDYDDSHQILTSDGTDLASCPGDGTEAHRFTVVVPGVQAPAGPVEHLDPVITVAGSPSAPATPAAGRIVSGLPAVFDASPPPTLSLQWMRCSSTGKQCGPIAFATALTYVPTVADVGSTLRFEVTAANASGSVTATSSATAVVQAGSGIAQLGNTPTGDEATFVYDTTELRLPVSATRSGTTADFAFFARGAGNTQVFTPRIYRGVNGQPGTLLGTGTAITVPRGTDARWYVASLAGVQLSAGTQYILALDPSGAYNGTYVGSDDEGSDFSFFVDYNAS